MTHPHIAALTLTVRDPDHLATFYCTVLGMTRQDRGGEVAVGYGGQGAALILRQGPAVRAYAPGKTDRYWKIAITLPDLDHAQQEIAAKGVAITDPHQFRDIAYMSHLADPEGHIIELIQHTFAGKPLSTPADPAKPLGGRAQIGLITLRTSDIAAEQRHCETTLGMRMLSRQSVADFGFDLYFLALTQDNAPSADVNALENREWLWQRPYTVLEFQHLLGGDPIVHHDHHPPKITLVTAAGQNATFF